MRNLPREKDSRSERSSRCSRKIALGSRCREPFDGRVDSVIDAAREPGIYTMLLGVLAMLNVMVYTERVA